MSPVELKDKISFKLCLQYGRQVVAMGLGLEPRGDVIKIKLEII